MTIWAEMAQRKVDHSIVSECRRMVLSQRLANIHLRRQMADVIHDDIAQVCTAISMSSSLLKQDLLGSRHAELAALLCEHSGRACRATADIVMNLDVRTTSLEDDISIVLDALDIDGLATTRAIAANRQSGAQLSKASDRILESVSMITLEAFSALTPETIQINIDWSQSTNAWKLKIMVVPVAVWNADWMVAELPQCRVSRQYRRFIARISIPSRPE